MKCRVCKKFYGDLGHGLCASCCVSRAARRKKYLKERYRSDVAAGRCTTCRKRPSIQFGKKCDECLSYLRVGPNRRAPAGSPTLKSARGYIPIDQWMETPKARVMRALRWLGWVEPNELWSAMGISNEDRQSDRFYQALRRLVKAGDAESRWVRSVLGGTVLEYRLKPGVSVTPPMDLSVCSDEEAA